MTRFGLLAVWLLVLPGPALGCEWDRAVPEDQGLVPESMAAAMLQTKRIIEVDNPEDCKKICCGDPDCDLALLSLPADGRPQCMPVSCTDRDQDRDLCVLSPSNQFKVYRKKSPSGSGGEASQGGHSRRVVPLIGAVKQETNQSSSGVAVCRQPVKVGVCRAFFPRFFYDPTNQSCRSFVYGGCGANGNNFISREECETSCSGVTGSVLPDDLSPEHSAKAARMISDINVSQVDEGPVEPAATESVLTQETEMSAVDFAERCRAEPEVGPCRASFQHWFYNHSTGSCQSFIYGGCQGNKNNYATQEECSATCTVSVVSSSKKVSSDKVSADYREACLVTSDPGPCRAAFSMFYFDPDTATCQSFIYGGCRGNQNRYSSMKECLSRCVTDGSSETREKTRDRWTAAVFLFITLAAISALLLATLVIVTLRRHRLNSHPSSISDKEELLPDEQSSLESLTVPETPKPDQA
ncbi:kunitz-type protease inhibitor 2 [Centropristis striata]|uniref:kunitz-type protease inhibitor 2 n=1 Tax=Centropristis striata TaxID=184440 RepID=UPI0027E006DE|nr:kunitz-type protease inhibitor 2 [Centropristis striata]